MPEPPSLNLEIGEFACYVSCSGEAVRRFPYVHIALCSWLRLDESTVFFSVDPRRLEHSTSRLNRTRSVVLLLTKKVFHNPYVVADIAKAIELDIPIVPISIEHGSFEIAKTFVTSPSFLPTFQRENPGATKLLEGIGIDLKRAHASLREKVSNFHVTELDLNCDLSSWYAAWNDIYKEIARVIKHESRTGGEIRVRAMRQGPYATFSDSDLRMRLESLRSSASPSRERGVDALNDLKRDVYDNRASVESVIAMAESVKANPTKLSICFTLVWILYDTPRKIPDTRMSINRLVNAIKDALLAFGQTNVDIARAACRAAAKVVLHNNVADDGPPMTFLHSRLVEAIIVTMKAFAGKDSATAASGCDALQALVWTASGDEMTKDYARLAALREFGMLEVLVTSMRAFGQASARAAFAGCQLISTLSRASGDMTMTLMRLGVGRAVLRSMKAFSMEYLMVNVTGAEAIADIAVRTVAVRRELMNLGAGVVVVEALRRAGSNYSDAASAGCDAVAALCEGDRELAVELMKLGAGDAVVRVMRAWGMKDANVAASGSAAINRLASPTNAVALMKMGAGEIVTTAMRTFGSTPSGVALDGCYAIGHLVTSANDAIELMKLGAGELVIAAMRMFGGGNKGAKIADAGCFAISQLCLFASEDDDDDRRSALMKLGAGEIVVKAMRAYGKTDVKAAEAGCAAIEQLARGNVVNQVALVREGAGEVVMEAMRTFGAENDDNVVASRGCGTISVLCYDNLDNALDLTRRGAGVVIISAMRAFGATTLDVAKLGIYAILDLIGNNRDDNARAFLRLGAAEVVLAGMNAFGDRDADVAHHGCLSLLKLAVDSDCVRALMELGAGETATAMIGSWGKSDWRAAWSGCWAISRLAVDEDTASALMERGAHGAVVEAMRMFGRFVSDVAEYGCLAIARLSGANKVLMMNLGAIEVVVQALRCQGTRCSEVADRACEAMARLITIPDLEYFLELGADNAAMEAMKMFGEIDAGVAVNGCAVIAWFAPDREWRSELEFLFALEELLGRISVSHVGNARVSCGVGQVMWRLEDE